MQVTNHQLLTNIHQPPTTPPRRTPRQVTTNHVHAMPVTYGVDLHTWAIGLCDYGIATWVGVSTCYHLHSLLLTPNASPR